MRLLIIIVTMAFVQTINAQHIDSILAKLNQPIQEGIENTITEMFGEQDTIFTETDSFILFTTPDMVWAEVDTVEYRYNEMTESYREWNYNGDELSEAMAVVYLADKRTGKPMDSESKQYWVMTTTIDEENFEISYFEDVIACHICGMGGGEPDISVLTKENKIELVEVRETGDYILNDEYKLVFEEGALLVENHISAIYHSPTENVFSSEIDRKTMMEVEIYEPNGGEEEKFRLAIMPAEMAKRITVDGILDEKEWNKDHKMNWRPVHSTLTGEKHTMNDLFAKYSISWNKGNIYIGLKVKDDKLVPMEIGSNEILGDHLKIDLNLNRYRVSKGQFVRGDKKSISLAIGFDKLGLASVIDAKSGQKLEDVKVVFVRNKEAGGYDAEIQLSTSTIKRLLGDKSKGSALKVGRSMNFTISVADADDMETKEIKHIDASSRMDEAIPFQMGKIELFKEYRMRTLEELKR